MSDEDKIDLRERLEAMDEKPRPKARRASPVVAAGGMLTIVAFGALLYVLTQGDTPEEALATAQPDDWQGTGPGFETMDVPARPEPASAAVPSPEPPMPEALPTGPSATELELAQTLADLRADLDAMREAGAQAGGEAVPDDGSDDQIDRLEEQLAALTSETAALRDRAEEAEQQVREQANAIRGLEAELEVAQYAEPAQLQGAGATLPTGADEEAARVAALEERRAQAEADRLARVTSPIIAFGGSAAPAAAPPGEAPDLGPDEAFLRAGARVAEIEQAVVIAHPSRTVIQGTMIQAVMETAIDSSLPGAIRAVVSEDVHSYDGTRILIPRGSKLIGRYNSQVEPTQRRLMVAWDRIVTPDGQSVTIAAYGADELGRSGKTGLIDRRLGTRFGSAALVSLISALPNAASAAVDDPVAADLAEELGDDAGDAAGSALDGYLSVPPTIFVDQGARVTVMVDRDLELF